MDRERTCVTQTASLLGYYCLCDPRQTHSPSWNSLCCSVKWGDGNNDSHWGAVRTPGRWFVGSLTLPQCLCSAQCSAAGECKDEQEIQPASQGAHRLPRELTCVTVRPAQRWPRARLGSPPFPALSTHTWCLWSAKCFTCISSVITHNSLDTHVSDGEIKAQKG